MKPSPMILAVALSTVFVCAARAQVNIEGTGSSVTASPGGAASFTYFLTNPGVSNVLVVGFYNDNATVPVGVTFDANPADGYAENDRTVAAYYFTPDESVDINITVNTAATSTGFFVYELSGIDDEGAVDLGTGSAITTTGDTKFVLNFRLFRGFSGWDRGRSVRRDAVGGGAWDRISLHITRCCWV